MTECEAFEAWASTRLMSIEVDTAWEAWQARAALANAERARVAKRCAEIADSIADDDQTALRIQEAIEAEFPEAK